MEMYLSQVQNFHFPLVLFCLHSANIYSYFPKQYSSETYSRDNLYLPQHDLLTETMNYPSLGEMEIFLINRRSQIYNLVTHYKTLI